MNSSAKSSPVAAGDTANAVPGAPATVTFQTLLDGEVTESAPQAYANAVELSLLAINPDADPHRAAHDALSRFAALSDAGLLQVIS